MTLSVVATVTDHGRLMRTAELDVNRVSRVVNSALAITQAV